MAKRNEPQEIPVYLFTGFLDGGKTTFIQSLLMDKEFNKGQTILVLQCEEGEEELDLSKLPGNTRVFTESIDEEDALSEELLLRLQKKYKPTRIMVEYNGMWMLDSLFEALPENSVSGQHHLSLLQHQYAPAGIQQAADSGTGAF